MNAEGPCGIFKGRCEMLTTPCAFVRRGEDVSYLIDEMWRLMRKYGGVGLAANQVGASSRVIIAKTDATIFEIINPVITWMHKSKSVMGYEGCLSFPRERILVPRNRHVKIDGFDREWNPIRLGATDMRARVLQHEIDHLDGITMHDRQAVSAG